MDTKKAIALGSLLAFTATAGAVFAAQQKPVTGQAPAGNAATPATTGSAPAATAAAPATPDQGSPTPQNKKHKKKHAASTTSTEQHKEQPK